MMMKKLLLFVCALILSAATFGQLTGIKNIPGSGGPNDYFTMASAIADLNLKGVGPGGVTFNVAAGYTETFLSPLSGLITATGSAANPVVFQKSGNGANPVVFAGVGTTTNVDGIIKIAGGDYFTFDGIDLAENPTNTNATTQMEWGYAMVKARNSFPVDGCQHITIRNCSISLGGSTTSTSGIYSGNHMASTVSPAPNGTNYTPADYTNDCKIYGNTISNVVRGINLNGYNNNLGLSNNSFDQNTEIGMAGAGNTINLSVSSTSVSYGIWTNFQHIVQVSWNTVTVFNSAGGAYGITTRVCNSADIHHNTVTVGSSSTSGITAIDLYASGVSDFTTEVHHNMIQNCSHTGSGTFSAIYGGTSAPSFLNIYSNTITGNTTVGGSMSLIGLGGGGGTTNNVYNNLIFNNTKTGGGSLYCINSINFQNCNIHDNQIYSNNIATTGVVTAASTITGIQSGQNNQTTETIYNNEIYDLNITGTTTSTSNFIYGINTDILSGATRTWYGNIVRNLSISAPSGSGTVIGMRAANGDVSNIYRNQVYNLQADNASGSVQGFNAASGKQVNIYNNFISDLRTPGSGLSNAITGITVSGGTGVGLYFNTVYLNASSTAGTFGTSGIFKSGATTMLDLRNNLVLNQSIPGNGGGLVVALRLAGTYNAAYYSALSNGNNFFAGIPGPGNQIFNDGLNSDQTLVAYQSRVAPKDAASFTENTTLMNTVLAPYNLHVNATIPTLCESGGLMVTNPAITDDIDGNARSTTPDVGANEFAGITTGVVNPTGFTASTVNSRQIDLSFQPNNYGNNVVIIWNTTGYFTTPSGTPPAVSGSFAGGTVLYNGVTSPLSHTGLIGGITYYYKAFSYDGTSYSTGISSSAATSISAPTGFVGYAMSQVQVDLEWTKNALDNDVVVAVNSTNTFGQPANGTTYIAGNEIPSGGLVLYSGPLSMFSQTGLTTNTKYYYKVWSVDEFAWYSSTGAATSATTMLCGPTSTIPFIEGFESYTPPAVGCGTILDLNGDGNTWRTLQGGSPAPHGGTKHLAITAGGPQSNNDWYFIQGLTLTGGMTYQLTFWYRPQYTSLAKVFEVKWGSSPTPAGMFNPALLNVQVSSIIATYAQATCFFTPSTSGTYYVGWHDMSPYDGANLYLDDINISGNSCSAALSVSAGPVTSTSADISWTGGGTTMQIDYGSTGHAAGTGTVITATGNPHTLNALTPLTAYDVFVRQDCGLGSYSFWTGPVSFTTDFLTPDVTTDAVTAPTGTGVTLNGTVNANGLSRTAYFEYGLTDAYGMVATAAPATVTGTTPTGVSSIVSGLIANGTTYHYRAVAFSAGVFTYGLDQTFTTDLAAPMATTFAATATTLTSATLNGLVNANNADAVVSFEYGTDLTYGTTVTAVPSTVSGNFAASVSTTISGLVGGTTYHYRVIATNSGGTSTGADMTFIASDPATALTLSASPIANTTATLNGLVSANGNSTVVTFDYGLTTSYGSTATAVQSPVTGDGVSVTAALASLTPNATYNFRIKAVNAVGVVYGNNLTFTTGCIPVATTGVTPTVNATTISFTGTVNAQNSPTTVYFDYGTSLDYGSTVNYPTTLSNAFNSSVPTPVTGLLPGTLYNYRVVASNVCGVTTGLNQTFTTPVMPSATTVAATPVGTTTATMKGTVNPNGSLANFRFEYGLTTAYGTTINGSTASGSGSTNVNINGSLTGLIPNTTYHYRVYAQKAVGIAYGADMTFTTTAVLPIVTTLAVHGLTPQAAVLNGTVNPNGSETAVTFEYGTTTSYGSTVTATPSNLSGNTVQSVMVSLSGLIPNTLYHYRVTGTNVAGGANGTDMTFTTIPLLPSIVTSPATMVHTMGAILHGTVNSNNASTEVAFEFGLTTAYGQIIPAMPSQVTGTGETPVSQILIDLVPNTLYHFRVVGVNAAGTGYGSDFTFMTPENNVSFTVTPIDPLCYSGTGSVILGNPIGGTPPYTFDPANPPLTGLTPGTYTYNLTDATGYPASASATINEAPSQLFLEATALTHPTCFNQQTGSVSLNATGGTPGYTYDPMNPPLTGLAGGTYTYYVTDLNGCQASATVTINPAPMLVINNPGICSPAQVNLTAPTVTAGSILYGAELSYWLDGNASIALSNPNAVGAGTYYIKAMLNEGCYDIQPVTAAIYPLPNRYNVTGGGSYCAGGAGAVVGVEGSQIGVTYSMWNYVGPIGNPIAGTGGPITFGPQTTTGIVLVLAENSVTGCSNWMYNSVNISVTQPVLVSVTISASANPSASGQNVTFTAVPVNGGYFPVYQWMVNGINVGTNSAALTYQPLNGDQVSCNLISSYTCTSGPGTSNVISMVVADVPVNEDITGIVQDGESRCFNAIETLTVAGTPTVFTVQSGGSAEMIAGQNIIYLPGTSVLNGGYMHGYISQTFCGLQQPAIVTVITGEEEPAGIALSTSISIYPNPTNGDFTLVRKGGDLNAIISVEIYSIRGEQVLANSLIGEKSHTFNFSDKPAGLYFVKIYSGSDVETIKLVKTR